MPPPLLSAASLLSSTPLMPPPLLSAASLLSSAPLMPPPLLSAASLLSSTPLMPPPPPPPQSLVLDWGPIVKSGAYALVLAHPGMFLTS